MKNMTHIPTNTTINWSELEQGDKMKITFDGKSIDVTFVRPGVVQKTASIFYIQDSVTHEWLYCFPQRLANMIAKGTDLANYKGRSTKAIERKAVKTAKTLAAKERQEKQLKAATEMAAKIANAKPDDPGTPVAPVDSGTTEDEKKAPVDPGTPVAPVDSGTTEDEKKAPAVPKKVAAKK